MAASRAGNMQSLNQWQPSAAAGSRLFDAYRFSDYIRLWLEQAKKRVDEVTYQGYDTLAQTHILPYFDALGIRLQEVTTKVLQAYFDEKRVNGRLDGKGGLSPKSLRLHKNVLFQR